MAKITVHPGGFIKRNYIDELGLTATELAEALEVSESTLSRLVHEKIDLSPALAVKLSKVLGRSAESWMAMQANHTLARYQAELEQWTPTKQVTAEGLVAVKGGKSKAKHKAARKQQRPSELLTTNS
jgi:addiction module HigA family antidote